MLSSFRLVSAAGLARSSPAYWDAEIDGIELHRLVESAGRPLGGEVGAIQDVWPDRSVETIERLLGVAPGDLPDGRVALFICSICGDLECGSVATHVVVGRDDVLWHGLASCYYDDRDRVEPIPAGGPGLSFRFRRDEYERSLTQGLARQQAVIAGRRT